MDFPGLDVKSLTDDEIYKRIGEITAKLMFVHHTSGNKQMVDQLDAILETLRFEQSCLFSVLISVSSGGAVSCVWKSCVALPKLRAGEMEMCPGVLYS